ncbi:MAG: CHAP domain-containing protein [Oscillospiraceae bacterium]|jgi:hypothetical protein|nr:CHAP domain-containing protein [Oscillospiraceae bacterium]
MNRNMRPSLPRPAPADELRGVTGARAPRAHGIACRLLALLLLVALLTGGAGGLTPVRAAATAGTAQEASANGGIQQKMYDLIGDVDRNSPLWWLLVVATLGVFAMVYDWAILVAPQPDDPPDPTQATVPSTQPSTANPPSTSPGSTAVPPPSTAVSTTKAPTTTTPTTTSGPEVIVPPAGLTAGGGPYQNSYVSLAQASYEHDQKSFLAGSSGSLKEKFVAYAESQVGYHEGTKINAGANAGKVHFPASGDWTKYGVLYNGSYVGAWCAVFVYACSVKAGASSSFEKTSYATINMLTGSNAYTGQYFSKATALASKPPARGDLIYFLPPGSPYTYASHVGIVTGYDSVTKTVYTVEGNYNNAVEAHSYSLDRNTSIKGFARVF